MAVFGSSRNYLRHRVSGEEAKVEFVELFFDLVFVFAITQLSHYLLHHMSGWGLVQATLLLMAVWWVWIDTAWCTNWLDPQRMPVRMLLFALMLAGLFVSTAIPDAFEHRGLVFALAFVAMQLGRSLFMMWALRRHSAANFLNFLRIFIWQACAAVFWIAGGIAEAEAIRFALWVVALAFESVGPAMAFRVPGLGASSTMDWDVEGAHLAERCGLFVIIALGESVLVAGATFAEAEWTMPTVLAFLVSFLGTVAMWWIYFNIGAGYASHRIAESADPGRMARVAYTYMPIVWIAGIIVVAVGDELVLAHPLAHHIGPGLVLTVVGGAALYVFGNALFKRLVFARWPFSHLVGLGLFALLAAGSMVLQPLAVAVLATAILILVAIWEYLSLKSLRT